MVPTENADNFFLLLLLSERVGTHSPTSLQRLTLVLHLAVSLLQLLVCLVAEISVIMLLCQYRNRYHTTQYYSVPCLPLI
jgi:hypothetical protein